MTTSGPSKILRSLCQFLGYAIQEKELEPNCLGQTDLRSGVIYYSPHISGTELDFVVCHEIIHALRDVSGMSFCISTGVAEEPALERIGHCLYHLEEIIVETSARYLAKKLKLPFDIRSSDTYVNNYMDALRNLDILKTVEMVNAYERGRNASHRAINDLLDTFKARKGRKPYKFHYQMLME